MKQSQGPLTEEEKILVRRWAAEGISYREIGKRLGRTKNSIVGHVHRLGLPGRPSPIIRAGPRASEPRPRRNHQPMAAGKSEMPALPSINGTRAPEPVSPPEPKPAPRPPMKWSKAQDDLLIELRRSGLPWIPIGDRFGVSGHAAQHRWSRLLRAGLVPDQAEKTGLLPNTLPALESQTQAEPPDIGVIQQLVDAFAKRRRKRQRDPKIVEAREPCCRYPMWGNWERPTHEFCNEKIYRGSWCARHYRVVFYNQSTRDEAIA